MSELGKIFGIDLGTTYSCIAYIDENGKPIVLKNAENDRITPSVVFFDEGEIIVGNVAKDNSKLYPDKVVSLIKRSIGDPHFVFESGGKTYRPEEISSFVLRKIVMDAELTLGESITDVVITIPAYFGINEREATANAGKIAGLNVRHIINEPTAAAISYGLDQTQDQVVLVYDLGGGTFDITMIEVKSREITVICTGGDHNLGGNDWDTAIVRYLASKVEEETGESVESILNDNETVNDLYMQAESAKKTLSQREKTGLAVTHGGNRTKVELTRENFDSLTENLLEQTILQTQEMLTEATKKGYSSFDSILLVGGSTRMLQVEKKLAETFQAKTQHFDPDESVACGAALFGYKLSLGDELLAKLAEQTGEAVENLKLEEVSEDLKTKVQEEVAEELGLHLGAVKKITETKIVNVTSKSFGIIATTPAPERKKIVSNLIIKNDPVPADIEKSFGTLDDNQENVELRIMENLETDPGKTPDPEICSEIGNAILQLPTGLPQNSPIEVHFSLSEDGRLTMNAVEKKGGRDVEVTIETASIMSREEVDEAQARNATISVS